jgi:hypothetical protein
MELVHSCARVREVSAVWGVWGVPVVWVHVDKLGTCTSYRFCISLSAASAISRFSWDLSSPLDTPSQICSTSSACLSFIQPSKKTHPRKFYRGIFGCLGDGGGGLGLWVGRDGAGTSLRIGLGLGAGGLAGTGDPGSRRLVGKLRFIPILHLTVGGLGHLMVQFFVYSQRDGLSNIAPLSLDTSKCFFDLCVSFAI